MKKLVLVIALLIGCAEVARASNSDEYLDGYIQSIFIHSYNLSSDAVEVKHGTVYIYEDKLAQYPPKQILEKVKQTVACLPNVRDTKLVQTKNNDNLANKNESLLEVPNVQKINSKLSKVDGIMANHSLFQPLIADPKWPRFTLAYQYHFKNGILRHAFAPNFGASFSLYRIRDNDQDQEWDISMQAGLFALMDIGRDPSALINADYFVGVPISYRMGIFSSLLRPYHISTHLGDEFMLTPAGKKTKRMNLSYEGVDLLLSYHINSFRIYGGGGYIVHKDPGYIKPLKVQMGAEHYSHHTYLGGRIRPICAIDFKADENAKWQPGISVKTGFQIENSSLASNKLQLMLEFYSGKSMHGQFFKDKIQTIGIGLHAFL